MNQNNVIHRNESFGPSYANRKVIAVEKSPLLNQSLTEAQPEVKETLTTVKPDASPEEVRSSKRAEFSALEKARQLESSANKKLKDAQELSEAYASGDLERIAKANGKSVSDYVRWINAKAVGTPTEKTLSPQEQIAENAKKWQETIEGKVKELDNEAGLNRKMGYINKNILPHIIKNPDAYEFVMDKDMDKQCDIVYNFMNEHFVESNGEELDPVELLNALEEKYMLEFKEEEKIRQEKKKKFKKLQEKIEEKPEVKLDADGKPLATKVSPAGRSVAHPNKSPDDALAISLAGDVTEDALAEAAPSNLVAGASRGSANSKRAAVPNIGTTPKGSKFSREVRLAEMAKNRAE